MLIPKKDRVLELVDLLFFAIEELILRLIDFFLTGGAIELRLCDLLAIIIFFIFAPDALAAATVVLSVLR